jgi:hypothetical protein
MWLLCSRRFYLLYESPHLICSSHNTFLLFLQGVSTSLPSASFFHSYSSIPFVVEAFTMYCCIWLVLDTIDHYYSRFTITICHKCLRFISNSDRAWDLFSPYVGDWRTSGSSSIKRSLCLQTN